MAIDWEKIIGTISNVAVAGSNIYATTIISQAQVGLYDTQKKTLNTQISLLKDTELSKKETTENVKKANQIKNKIVYGEYITEDEYNFLVGLGYDVGFSYQQYIDYITSDTTQPQILSETQSQQNNQSNLKTYLILGSIGLIGGYLFLRGRK
jgi:hypothetical protein